jgi:rubredoxin
VVRWGRPGGTQRYRCTSCRRTFTDRTGTPLARRQKGTRWAELLQLMQARVPLRETASQLDIHISTAFRWRHAVLGALHHAERPRLTGIVELTQIPVAFSEKGSRRLPPDSARERGGRVGAYTSAMPRTRVIIALNREGAVRSADAAMSLLQAGAVRQFLEAELDPACTLFFAGRRLSPFGSGARSLGFSYTHVTPTADSFLDPLSDLAAANAYARELRRWLRGFRGVATRYLEHYLAWHRLLYEGSAWPGGDPAPGDSAPGGDPVP